MANKITVTSVGTTANVNATPDSARYYSDKSKEWAIGEKLIDNTDYSSKYYANESKKQADIATAKTTEVIESGNTAVSNIESARDNAITDITNQENLSVDNVNTAGATQVALATEQANIATQQATIATNKTSEVVASGNEALSNINTAKTGALTDITDLKNTSISSITTAKNSAISTITTQETTSKNNVIATGNEQVERVNLTGVDNRTPIFSKNEIGTNEGVYKNVYDLKHSTFDLSKFTVVGSPTITDDGVASGFSSNNYLTVPFTPSNNTWQIEYKFKLSSIASASDLLGGNSASSPSLAITANNARLRLSIGNGSAWQQSNIVGSTNLSANTDYYFKLEYTGSKYNLYLSTDGENWILETTYTSSTATGSSTLNLGVSRSGAGQLNGSIDLKQFSITVDGKEVFNGNKTGIDVIKPDNYTVVGSPVISDDGVASGFRNNNYLTSPLSITPNTYIKIKADIIYSTVGNTSDYPQAKPFWTLGFNGWRLLTNYGTGINFIGSDVGQVYMNVANFKDGDLIKTETIITNKEVTIKVNYKDKEYTTSKLYDFSFDDIKSIKIGSMGNPYYFTGSVDLNAFKIYVDGNLVYQPCLKIPYTLSKTGSKIVDEVYRDRVIDLYEQEGQAGYYTIDEENQNFTLPMGEIYGMIGQRSLISSTVTETNRVDIYSDKTCLICGNVATAGTINLPIELANNNYFITLSTSTKTATSFNTTATGDYILIGKVA